MSAPHPTANFSPTLGEWTRLGNGTSWKELRHERSGFQREFVRMLIQCPQVGGRVLDVGCGGGLPGALAGLEPHLGELDGVDPDPAVQNHPLLRQRWCGPLESSGVPSSAYDLAYAYNVVEHLPNPRPFFERIHGALKPGGVFWALTPNALHPFALLSRSIELIGLKGLARHCLGRDEKTGAMQVNDYPAYYRCNRPATVLKAIEGLGFRRASFYFHPCVQWDTYFPRALRWLPRGYDRLVGTRFGPLMQLFILRLDK